MSAQTSGEKARPSAISRSSFSRPLAVTSLFSPASKAAWSSTPRSTLTPVDPQLASARWIVGTPTTSTSRFVAKLLDLVIIW